MTLDVDTPSSGPSPRPTPSLQPEVTYSGLADALTAEATVGELRRLLVLTLLEDPERRLSGLHAEALIRWKLMVHGSSTSYDFNELAKPVTEPIVLRAALTEDDTSQVPVFRMSQELRRSVGSSQPSRKSSDSTQHTARTAWMHNIIQLDLAHLFALLKVPQVSDNRTRSPATCSESDSAKHNNNKDLPSVLFDYEPTTSPRPADMAGKGMSVGSVARPPAIPRAISSGNTSNSGIPRPPSNQSLATSPHDPLSLANRTSPTGQQGMTRSGSGVFSPHGPAATGNRMSAASSSVPDIPEEVASCWDAGNALVSSWCPPIAEQSAPQDMPLPTGSYDAHGQGHGLMSAYSLQSQSGFDSLAGSLRPGQYLQSSSYVGNPTLPGSYNGRIGLMDRRLSIGANNWLSTSPSHGSLYQYGHDGGMHNVASYNSLADVHHLGSSSMLSGSLPTAGLTQMQAFSRQHSLVQHMSVQPLSQDTLTGQHDQNVHGQNLGVSAPRGAYISTSLGAAKAGVKGGQTQQLRTSEDGQVESPGGNMDLETALEAIINFESSASGEGRAGVSAATAAAAQQAIKQHVDAAVRAAAASASGSGNAQAGSTGGGSSKDGSSSTSPSESGHGGNASGLCHETAAVSFASAARNLAASRTHNSSHVNLSSMIGSAPAGSTMGPSLANMSYTSLAAAQMGLTPEQAAAVGFSAELHSMAHHDAAQDRSALLGHIAGLQAAGMGTRPVSLSAPRTGAWPGNADGKDALLHPGSNDNLLTSAMLGSSAPMSVNKNAFAAARNLAAAHNQGVRAHMTASISSQHLSALASNPGLNQFGSVPNASAYLAASRGQMNNLQLLQHVNAGGRVPGVGMMLNNGLSTKMKADLQQLLLNNGAGKMDDAVLAQLLASSASEDDTAAALRAALAAPDLGLMQQQTLAAYLGGGGGAAGLNLASISRSSSSATTATRALLQKLPPRVLGRLEEVVSRCSYMDWKHFDAGVVKVMVQLSELSEADVLEELQLLEATDLSNVEYMPAYLNKRLNNRLWSRRKAQQAAAAAAMH